MYGSEFSFLYKTKTLILSQTYEVVFSLALGCYLGWGVNLEHIGALMF